MDLSSKELELSWTRTRLEHFRKGLELDTIHCSKELGPKIVGLGLTRVLQLLDSLQLCCVASKFIFLKCISIVS